MSQYSKQIFLEGDIECPLHSKFWEYLSSRPPGLTPTDYTSSINLLAAGLSHKRPISQDVVQYALHLILDERVGRFMTDEPSSLDFCLRLISACSHHSAAGPLRDVILPPCLLLVAGCGSCRAAASSVPHQLKVWGALCAPEALRRNSSCLKVFAF